MGRDDSPWVGSARIVLLGNPNVGKSIIFGHLTGRYATVSNYPGTTVEISRGEARIDRISFLVLDTPGINNLLPSSEEERVTRDILLEEGQAIILQVADAKNLRRALLLTLQLVEMGLPLVLNLNLMDEAGERGIKVDVSKLSRILGIPVVATVATRGKGLEELNRSIAQARPSPYRFSYSAALEEGISRMEPYLPSDGWSRRSLALMLLGGDKSLERRIARSVPPENREMWEQIRKETSSRYADPLGYVIDRERLEETRRILEQVVEVQQGRASSLSKFLERWSLHPLGGLPLLLLSLLLAYLLVGYLGARIWVGFMEEVVFGRFINPWAIRLISILPGRVVHDFLVGPYGLITMALTYAVAIVLPVVTTFFLFFGLLEDSGYLPRLAAIADRSLRSLGLSGKALLPLVLGLGCDTMATLSTRILETEKDRILVTLLLSLAVPCSAQLGVIMSLLGGLSVWAIPIWAGTVLGAMVLVGSVACRIVPGSRSDFILELPPLRLPQVSNLLLKTAARIEWYLKEAVPLFVLGTTLLFGFDKLGLLQRLEAWSSPLITGILGLPRKATEAFMVGFLRRDYGAAGLYMLAKTGEMDHVQILVGLVAMTLFVPCIAQLLVTIKERGWKVALLATAFISCFAFLVGGALNLLLRTLRVAL
jgi:ferrous iron transport protein B